MSLEVTRKWRHFTGSHLEVAVEGLKLAYTIHFTSYNAVAPVGGSHVTVNDVTWPQVTGCDPQVTFDRKSPRSGYRRPKTRVSVHFTSYNAVASSTRHSCEGNDVKRPQETGSEPEVTSFDRKTPGSGCRSHKLALLYISLPRRL